MTALSNNQMWQNYFEEGTVCCTLSETNRKEWCFCNKPFTVVITYQQ